MVDYRKFLAKTEELVLPYLGGTSVETKDRRFRLKTRPAVPGWYKFTIAGREATLTNPETVDPVVDGLAKLRGNLFRGWLFAAGGKPEEVLLLPEDEAPWFQSISARRWHGGEALFEGLEFDGDAEEAVRRAIDEGTTLKDAKGVTPPLRVAYAWELVRRAAVDEKITVRPTEVARYALEIAEGGDAVAKRALDEIIHARRGGRVQVVAGGRVYVRELVAAARRANKDATWANVEERAEDALHAAGARLLGIRRIDGRIEVRFRFSGDSFTCIADPMTLRVLDAGVCLVDHDTGERGDEELTLDSLPSVLNEAMELGVLVHTRH